MEKKIIVENNQVVLSINPKVYDLEVVYSASYVFLDKSYVLLDGDPNKEIIVKLKLKEKGDLNKLGYEFFNELLNYSDYKKRSEQTKEIREMILQRSLLTNDLLISDQKEEDFTDEEFDKLVEELEKGEPVE